MRKGESVRDRADLFFVILSFTAKAVPSNEYKYKKKKKINSRTKEFRMGVNRIPFPPKLISSNSLT